MCAGAKDEGNFGNHGAGAWELSMESVIKAVASGGGGDGDKTHKKKAAAAVIVVMAVPGPILTASWAGEVDAILCPFLPGEQYGNAITDLIFGDIAPQAKVRTKQLSLTPFSKLMLKHIVIPRQARARDKHRESTQSRGCWLFSRAHCSFL